MATDAKLLANHIAERRAERVEKLRGNFAFLQSADAISSGPIYAPNFHPLECRQNKALAKVFQENSRRPLAGTELKISLALGSWCKSTDGREDHIRGTASQVAKGREDQGESGGAARAGLARRGEGRCGWARGAARPGGSRAEGSAHTDARCLRSCLGRAGPDGAVPGRGAPREPFGLRSVTPPRPPATAPAPPRPAPAASAQWGARAHLHICILSGT